MMITWLALIHSWATKTATIIRQSSLARVLYFLSNVSTECKLTLTVAATILA